MIPKEFNILTTERMLVHEMFNDQIMVNGKLIKLVRSTRKTMRKSNILLAFIAAAEFSYILHLDNRLTNLEMHKKQEGD